MAGWKTLSTEVVYETPWIKMHRDEVLNQNGDPLTYSYMELQNPSVFVVAVNDKGEILLQSVYRYTIRKRVIEIPAGYINPGEDIQSAAVRELREEAGLTSDDWQSLGCINQIIGIGIVPVYAFLARNARPDGNATDKDEDINDRRFKKLEDIEEMIRSGEMIDSPVIAILYMAKLHGEIKEAK
jgi:ADP-ribose pyrophosphatase